MNNIIKSIKTVALVLVLAVGIGYVSAWTTPTSAPPLGNATAPVNISSTGQVKAGSLGVSGLLRGYGNAIFNGNVGIGTTANSADLKLDVEGKVGATQYCDANGANCVASGGLGGGKEITSMGCDNPGRPAGRKSHQCWIRFSDGSIIYSNVFGDST